MFKKISITLAVIYGLVIIATIVLFDVTFIYAYQKKTIDKNEAKNVIYGNIISNIGKGKFDNLLVLNQEMRENCENIDGRVLILNNESIVLADKYGTYLGKQIKNSDISKAIELGVNTIGYYLEDNHRIMTVTTPIKYNGEIEGATVISVFIDSIFEDIQDLKKQLIIISFIAGILAVMLSFYMGNKLSKPIEKLTKASEQIRRGKLDVRVDIKRKDEIGKLAESFNQMTTDIYNIDINRRQFISNISHELNTPLASIKALIEALIDGDDDISVYKEYLGDVNSEIDRLSILIKALLKLSCFDEIELHKEPVNLHDEVESLARLFNSLLKQNDMILNNYCDKELLISADRGMLREVLVNLIDNSIKYGKEKGIIDISCCKKNNFAISIKDNGIGIPEKDISFLFDLFFKVDKSRSEDVGGRGIGLYIVKKIVSLHGWTIQVNSVLGEKTEFLISINEQ